MTKSVCTGTRALVKTLPSGHISEEVWEVVDDRRICRHSKKDMRPILMCGVKEAVSVCREMLRLVGVKHQQVRLWNHRLSHQRFCKWQNNWSLSHFIYGRKAGKMHSQDNTTVNFPGSAQTFIIFHSQDTGKTGECILKGMWVYLHCSLAKSNILPESFQLRGFLGLQEILQVAIGILPFLQC